VKKVAVIVGHHQKAQGAVSYNGLSEWSYNNGVAMILQELSEDHDDIEIRTFTKHGLDYKPIVAIYKDWNPDISLELHFNSYKKVARGMECLVLQENPETFKVADLFTDYMSELLDISERRKAKAMDGVLVVGENTRGRVCLEDVTQYAKHAMLFEPCFGNLRNPDSLKLFADHGEFYAAAFYKALRMLLNLPHETKPQKQDLKQRVRYLESKIEQIKELLNGIS